jgi:hypothetical protein
VEESPARQTSSQQRPDEDVQARRPGEEQVPNEASDPAQTKQDPPPDFVPV